MTRFASRSTDESMLFLVASEVIQTNKEQILENATNDGVRVTAEYLSSAVAWDRDRDEL